MKVEWETTDPIQLDHANIPFLDLLIKRSPSGFLFSVYRKPTATDLYTHFYSSHPLSTKIGVLTGLYLRGFRICSPETLESEIKHLNSTFKRLCYPAHVISKAFSKARSRFHNPTTRDYPKSKYHLCWEYHPNLEPIRHELRKIGVSTTFSSSNTLGNVLSKTGPVKSHDSELPGVYKAECKNCPEGVYYGETGVSLAKRMSDHKTDIRKAKESNALFVHMKDNPGHSFDLQGAKLLYKSNHKSKRQLVESSLIATNPNCNLRLGDYPVCRITAPAVLKGVKLDNSRVTSTVTPASTIASTTVPVSTNVSTPSSATTTSDLVSTNAPIPSPALPAIAPTSKTTTLVAPTLPTSNLTQALNNMAINSSSQPQISHSNLQLPVSSSTMSTPVARHTRSRKRSTAATSKNATLVSESPLGLQSQARACSPTHYAQFVCSPAVSHHNSPRVKETVSHIPLSQCHSPRATTGATRKRRFIYNQSSSPDIFSPMAKRLRSSKLH